MGIIVCSQLLQAYEEKRSREAATCGKTVYGSPEWGALFANPSRYRNRGKRGQLDSAYRLSRHYTDRQSCFKQRMELCKPAGVA
jgi:hypothetical protein